MVGMVTNGTMAGVFDVWNNDWSSVGWHDCWEQTYGISASSFSLGVLDVGATSSPKFDENGLFRSLNGRFTGVHKVLCGVAEIVCEGRQDFYLRHDGGYMIPIHSKIGQGMRIHFEKLMNW